MVETKSSFDAFLTQCTNQTEAAAGGDIFPEAQAFPATGQTTAFNADKNDGVVGGVAVPDDGTLTRGATLAFVDNGNGTLSDVNTGLMWEKKDDSAASLHHKDHTFRWSGSGTEETIWDWIDDVNAEGGTGFGGHSDWRIPNIKELQGIVNYQVFTPAITSAFNSNCVAACTVITCSCTVSSLYWSSSTYALTATSAWNLDFGDGRIGSGNKADDIYVRAVRSGL